MNRMKIASELLKLAEALVGRRRSASWVDDLKDKVLGRDLRVRYDGRRMLAEELPQKGKKRLRVLFYEVWPYLMSTSSVNASPLIVQNLLRDIGFNESMDYDRFAAEFAKAAKEAAEGIDASGEPHYKPEHAYTLQESQVHFLKVAPEGAESFIAEASDFKVKVEWDKWQAYDPDSDFQSADPTYTKYESSSSNDARKMYRILRADPNALRNVSWFQFGDWLKHNGVNYQTHFSVYR